MLRSLHLALILCIALTGIGLGAARGTVQVGGQIVLCSGHAIAVSQGADGSPDGQVYLCPDMALSMLQAIAGDAPLDTPHRRVIRVATGPDRGAVVAFDPPPAQARAPPA